MLTSSVGEFWGSSACFGAIGELLSAAVEAGLPGEQAHRLTERLRSHVDSARLAAEPVHTFASAGTLSV